MDELEKKLNDEFNKLGVDIQAKLDLVDKGKLSMSEFKAYQEQNEARTNKILDEIAAIKTPKLNAEEIKAEAKTMATKALEKYLRGREDLLTPEERKTLTIGDPATGGYLATGEYIASILKNITEYSPVRSIATVRSTSKEYVEVPKRTGQFSAAWVSEIGTRSERTGLTYGLEKIPVHEMYAMVKISKHNLEDSEFNLENEIGAEMGEQFGVLEGTAFISGNSVGQPEGILTNSSVTGFTGVTTSAKIVADDLINLQYALKAPYVPGATWLLKRSSTLAIRLLKNGTTGDYLWQPGFQSGAPATILNSPYLECPDMPAEGSSAKAVAYGDFRKGYLIVDRIAVEMLRDPYTSKSTGCIEISGRKRVGGQVVLPEAIKVYTLKA